MNINLKVKGRAVTVDVDPATPLLYILSDDLALRGPKFGCGLGQCGSCTVIVKGQAVRSCVTQVSAVAGSEITTLEGLPGLYAQQRGLKQPPALHPLQQAFLELQAAHCGACYNGMTIKASELLARNPRPSETEIRQHMNGHLCRCGTYQRIMKGIELAASRMEKPV